MAETKLGIAISLYDKFNELEILTEIFRENFEREYFIAVSCSHPKGQKIIDKRDIDIDTYIQTGEIEYKPEMEGTKRQIHLISRIFNSIQESMDECFDNSEYAMHIHADAWPLDEKKLYDIIKKMEGEDKKVAVKGKGPGGRTSMWPMGHVNDHFMFFKSDYAKEKDLFDHNPLDLMPDRGIHTALMLLLLGNVGWSNVLYYSNNSKQIGWTGKPVNGNRPMMYNTEWNFLHLAREDFPENYGKSIQASYLSENSITEGENVEKIIKNHHKDKETIRRELNEIKNPLDRKLKLRGYFNEESSNDIVDKKERLESCRTSTIIKNYAEVGFKLAYNTFLRTPFGGMLKQYVKSSDPIKRAEPEEIFNIYSESIEEKGFPNEYVQNAWFKQ